MYKQFFGLICILFCATKSYSACRTDVNPVNFQGTMVNALNENGFLQLSSQTVESSSPQPISDCTGNGYIRFSMVESDLSTSSTVIKDGFTYYQIPLTYITPALPADSKVYIAFSVKDNQNNADEKWVNSSTATYDLYYGSSDTRGIRLQNVRLLLSGLSNAEGAYSIGNPRLGLMTATDSIRSRSTVLRLSGIKFSIRKTTCVVNGGTPLNVTLPTVRTTDFTAKGQTLGEKDFTVNVSGCNSGTVRDTGKTLVALLTDSYKSSESNSSGLLTNFGAGNSTNVAVQITDNSSTPVRIAPKSITSSDSFFNFGRIDASGNVSKTFKARYYANELPVPATNVSSQATITLIYN